MNFDKNNLKKQFIQYIIPSIASQIVFTLYSMVDAIFVARGVSAKALAAVNISVPFTTFLFAVSITAAVGTSTQVARLYGEGKGAEAKGIFSMNFSVAMIISVLVTLATLVFTVPLANVLGATDSTRDYVVTYLRTLAPFSVFFILSYIFEILLAADGFPAKATKIVTIGVAANFVLDYLLIFVVKWGVFGAAFATGFSQLLVTVVYLFHFLGPKGHIKFSKFKFDWKIVGASFYKGLPSGVMEVSPGIITFILVHYVTRNLGEDGLVAFSSMAYMAGIMIILAVGVAQGAQPIISFFNGKQDFETIRKLYRYELIYGLTLEVIMYLCVCLASRPFASLFLSGDADYLIEYTSHWMKFYLFFAIVDGFVVITSITLTALEKPLPGIVFAGLRCTVFLLIGCIIMTAIGGNAIWFAMLAAEIQTTVAYSIVLNKKRYLKGE